MLNSIYVCGISAETVGDTVTISVLRDGETIEVLSLTAKDDKPLKVTVGAEDLYKLVESKTGDPLPDKSLSTRFQEVFKQNEGDVLELLNSLEMAWGIIANAESRLWALPQDTNNVWINAARKWRDEDWHGALNKHLKNKNDVDSRIEPPAIGGDS